jgi:hypothetical protein
MYVMMTAAILLAHYKKQTSLKGYKIVKRKFAAFRKKSYL